MTVGKTHVGSAELVWDVRGKDGPAVVQLHGLTSSRARDEALGLDLTVGARDARVLRYDARGHGRSSGSDNPVDYVWTRLAEDLLALLEDVFPGEPVHAVGQSMGAATLFTAVVAEPARFASLVPVLAPTAWGSRVAQAAVYEASARLVERRGLGAFVDSTRGLPLPPAVDPDRPDTVPDVREEWLPAAFRGAAGSDLPGEDALSRIVLPTLLLSWSDDPSHPVEVAERLAEVIRGSRLERALTPVEVARWPALLAAHLAAHTH